jgi:hypothetical protein
MADIILKDILIGARQESYRMRHFYVGTEHLFIAVLSSKGGLSGSIIQEYGLTPEYVIDAIRRKIGKGGKHRLWAGVPNTPRTEVLLGIANDLALEAGREEISERDLLTAIFEEDDNIPVRVLNALGLNNIEDLTEKARNFSIKSDSQHAFVKVNFGADFDQGNPLSSEQLLILRRMFEDCAEIRIERRLPENSERASLLMVTPICDENQESATTIVKMDQVNAILDESQRYAAYVQLKLPTTTARIANKPIAPEMANLAGIQYTLPTGGSIPQDFSTAVTNWNDEQLEKWLHRELFPVFGHHWWQKNKPHRFQVWREYDWMLPPIMTLDLVKEKNQPPVSYVIKMPVDGKKIHKPGRGDVIAIENFVVEKVYPERNMILLASGQGTDAAESYKVQLYGIDLSANTFYRGEVIESIVGRVRETRKEQLIKIATSLEPPFNVESKNIPFDGVGTGELPNPIFAYKSIAEASFTGVSSMIHGNLHPGCIIVNDKQGAFLVDFAHVRDGHTLFDWAMLESTLLSQDIMPTIGESWDDAKAVIKQLIELNDGLSLNELDANGHLPSVAKVRGVAQKCLLDKDNWTEYFIALAFCSMHAMTREDLSTGGRRLMFLASALAFHELQTRFRIED